ncbi:MAG: NADH-quinone oxidoreductase subunit L, partial [Paracoccaceae bacterium]|nr:NADH-quinone oxidoreductase subunit L [Paracoccaceae bacterium]
MFAAAGAGVYGVAMFHLLTHAAFKALLFLCAGSVITAMHHEQDMRNYGGLRKKIPFTFWMMMFGTLAITGVGIPFSKDFFGIPIGFAGFDSKDAIIEGTWASGSMYGFWLLVIAAAFTAFYSWRLIFMTFYGPEKGDHHAHEHAKESPLVMLIPLGVLGFGAVFAGMIWYNSFFGNEAIMSHFFALGEHAAPGQGAIFIAPSNHVIETAHHAPVWVGLSPFVAMLLGFGAAWVMYIAKPDLPARMAAANRPLYEFLLNKWYFDEIYGFLFVRPAMALGRLLWKQGDGEVIDGSINGVAMGIVPWFTRLAGRAQSGYLFHYAFAMVIGIGVLMTWMTLTGGAH